MIVYSTSCALASRNLHVIYLLPSWLYDVIIFACLYLHFILAVITPKHVDFLGIVNSGEEVSKSRHLIFVGIYLFALLEYQEIVVRRTSEQEIRVVGGNKHDRKVKRELLFATRVYFPFQSVDRKPSNRVSSKLKPVAALVQHQSRVLVIIFLDFLSLFNLIQRF